MANQTVIICTNQLPKTDKPTCCCVTKSTERSYKSQKLSTHWLGHLPSGSKKEKHIILTSWKNVQVQEVKEKLPKVLQILGNFFSPERMISNIMTFTNQKLCIMNKKHKNTSIPTDDTEMFALFCLLYLMDAKIDSCVNTNELCSKNGVASEIYGVVMGEQWFLILLQVPLFDNSSTRQQSEEVNNLAPTREVFEKPVSSCQKFVSTIEFTAVDEDRSKNIHI